MSLIAMTDESFALCVDDRRAGWTERRRHWQVWPQLCHSQMEAAKRRRRKPHQRSS